MNVKNFYSVTNKFLNSNILKITTQNDLYIPICYGQNEIVGQCLILVIELHQSIKLLCNEYI